MRKVWIVLVAFFVMLQVFPTMAEDSTKDIVKMTTNLKDCSIPIGFDLSVSIKLFMSEEEDDYKYGDVGKCLTADPADLGIITSDSYMPLKAGKVVLTARFGEFVQSATITVYEYKSTTIDLMGSIETGSTFKPTVTITDVQGNKHPPFSVSWQADTSGNFDINNETGEITVWAASGKAKLFCTVNRHWVVEKQIDVKKQPGEHLMIDSKDIFFGYSNAWRMSTYQAVYIRNTGTTDIPFTCSVNCGWVELRQVPKVVESGKTVVINMIASPCLTQTKIILDGLLEIKTPNKDYKIKLSYINLYPYHECGSCSNQKFSMVLANSKVTLDLPIFGKQNNTFRLESDNPRFIFDDKGYKFPETNDAYTQITVDTTNPPPEGMIKGTVKIITEHDCQPATFEIVCNLVNAKSRIVLEKNSDIATVDGKEVKLASKVAIDETYWLVPLYSMCNIFGINVQRLPTQRSVTIYNSKSATSFFDKDATEIDGYRYERRLTELFNFDAPETMVYMSALKSFGDIDYSTVDKKLIIDWVTEPFTPAK